MVIAPRSRGFRHRYSRKIACPYGQHGDRLWIKETWRAHLCDGRDNESIHYAADGPACPVDGTTIKPWRPSIFMPHWASRLTLEITKVRVERLQEISEEDCIAEGIEKAGPHGYGWRNYTDPAVVCSTPRQSYFSLWESINGKGSLANNPWVWVIEFKRIKP